MAVYDLEQQIKRQLVKDSEDRNEAQSQAETLEMRQKDLLAVVKVVIAEEVARFGKRVEKAGAAGMKAESQIQD